MPWKIMVVDDEPDVLKLIKAMVEPLGCDVITIQDSREAAQRLTVEKVDGVFVDVRMPHIDGFELTRFIRTTARNDKVPIVLLTGLDDAQTMRKGFQAGATMFLGKPFTHERMYSLFNAMRSALFRERRRYVRLPFRAAVRCSSKGRNFTSSTLDIAEGGMLIEPSGRLDVGEELDLEFNLPSEREPLRVRGRVVRKEPPDRAGIEFTNVPSREKEMLLTYITAAIKV